MLQRFRRRALAFLGILFTTPSLAGMIDSDRDKPDVDLYALMSGKCPTLEIAGRAFACKAVAYFHTEKGRANFTVALDDPADASHIISFSGEYGHRSQDDLCVLAVDRMKINSKDRPKVDGLPVPAFETSNGACRQDGVFARLQVSSINCTATDRSGRQYQLQFESDGSPIIVRRVRQSEPTIRQDPYH